MSGHDSSNGAVDLREMLFKAVGPKLAELFQDAAQTFLPDCYGCAKKSIPLRCKQCGQFACTDHAYVNAGRLEVICQRCLNGLLRQAGGEVNEDTDPWEVLGIDPGATKEEVESAYRVKARKCHPDFHPGDEAKAEQWRQLQWAHEELVSQQA